MYGILIVVVSLIVMSLMSVIGWIIGVYNTIVNAKEQVKNQFSNVVTEYQRRFDLLPNLAKVVKSYKEFEKETMTLVAKYRSGNIFQDSKGKDKPIKEQMGIMKQMDKAMYNINAVFEKYPDLKSDRLHIELMNEVRITEDRINVSRTDYNNVVRDFNIYILEFPTNMISSFMKIVQMDYYEPHDSKAVKTAPILKL